MDTPLTIEHVYEAPTGKVWQALTQTHSMRAWYFPQLDKFEPVLGADFVFANDGSAYRKA